MKLLIHKQSGFTLIELMVIVIVIGILGTIGFPNLQNFMRAQVIGVKSDSVTNAFRLGRAEALSRVRPITVEWNPSSTAAIARTGFAIQPGHIAVYDTGDAAEQLIKQFSYLDDNIIVNTTDNNARTFSAQGRINAAVSFVYCKEAGDTEDSYQINVLVSGQVTSDRNVGSCTP